MDIECQKFRGLIRKLNCHNFGWSVSPDSRIGHLTSNFPADALGLPADCFHSRFPEQENRVKLGRALGCSKKNSNFNWIRQKFKGAHVTWKAGVAGPRALTDEVCLSLSLDLYISSFCWSPSFPLPRNSHHVGEQKSASNLNSVPLHFITQKEESLSSFQGSHISS